MACSESAYDGVLFLYKMKAKREGTGFPIPSQKVQNMDFFLAEVALQQALESLAVAGLDISSHCNRLVPHLGVVQAFDRSIEGIHIAV